MNYFLLIMILLPQYVLGQQNLVPNGSFEEHTDCPTADGQIYFADPWTSLGLGLSSDYYNACAPLLIYLQDTFLISGVPINNVGIQMAKSGEAYGGIHTYGGPTETNGREYLQVSLTQSLHPGRYVVSFWASLADKFDYAVGSLGAYLSDTLVTRTSYNSLPGVEPSIQSPSGQIFSDKDIWYLITDTFVSRVGGERYLAIGNFKSTEESDTLFVPTNTPPRRKSYYFIDDVSVIALDSVPESIGENGALQLSVSPNPATEAVQIEGRGLAKLRLLDMSGRVVLVENIATDRHIVHLARVPPGLYLLEVENTEGRKAVQKLLRQ